MWLDVSRYEQGYTDASERENHQLETRLCEKNVAWRKVDAKRRNHMLMSMAQTGAIRRKNKYEEKQLVTNTRAQR